MSLESIVSVAITAASKTPTRPGFGTPLIPASKVPAGWGSAKTKTYGSLSEMIDVGWLVTDPAYQAAAILKSASPSIRQWKVGKRSLVPTKLIRLTVVNITEGYIYSFKVGATTVTYTVLAAATTTTVATALAALIDADAVVSATSALAVITITAAAGVLFDVEGWYDDALILKDETADPGIATDLAAWQVADKDWYGLCPGPEFGKAENIAAAAWVLSNKKLAVLDTCDTEAADSGDTDDVGSVLKGLTNKRCPVLAHNTKLFNFGGASWIGTMFPGLPGSATWKFKSLAGVAPSTWTEGEKTALFAKNINTYTVIAGLGITETGKTPGGEWIDVTWGLDWLESEMKIQVFAALANAPKIPYTNAGRDQILSVIEGVLALAVKRGILAADPEPFATGPDVDDVDAVTRGERVLPDLEFDGRLAGAIHEAQIAGTVSV